MKLDSCAKCGGKPIVVETDALYISCSKCDYNVDRAYTNLKIAYMDWNRKQELERNRET